MKVTLEVMSGPTDGQVYHFHKSVGVGREDSNEISLPLDKFISRRHARIMVIEPECFLEDLDSTNGTFVDGERLRGRILLEKGKLFRVGKTWLHIDWQEARQ
jgi:pSer/pThr/pTyr-binding forkhead associated (FHA) protein